MLTLLLTAAVWQLSATPVMAQLGGNRIQRPLDRPTVSPYLNLFRRGNSGSPILNYYGLVRPQQEFYQQHQDLEQGRYNFQQPQNQSLSTVNGQRIPGGYTMGITGHGVSFMTHGSRSGEQNSAGFGTGNRGNPALPGAADSSLPSGQGYGNSFGTGSYSGHSAGFGYGSYGQRSQF